MPCDKNLTKARQDCLCAPTHMTGIDRHIAPAQNPLPLLFDGFIDNAFAGVARSRIAWQENLADAVTAPPRHIKPKLKTLALVKSMRQLHQNAGAIAGLWIGAAGSTMTQPP